MPAHASVGGMTVLAVYAGLTVLDAQQRAAVDAACRGCHPAGVGVNHAPIFPLPHQNAAGTVVAVCADCHVDRSSRKVLGCAACHPHSDPATATGHAAVPGFSATDSALCARCHGDSTIPAVATHTSFAIEGSSRHQGLAGGACLQCHPATRPAPKTFAADFAVTTCTTCHVPLTNANLALHDDGTALAAFHLARNVTDFTFTDAACLKCHPDGSSGAPSYHPQLFPIDPASKHAGIACGDCHAAGSRSDVVNMKCASCHADPSKSPKFPTVHNPTGVTVLAALTPAITQTSCTPVAFAPTSLDCLRCHALSHVDLAANHPGGDSAFGTGRHKGAGCTTCHLATRQVAVSPAPTPPPAGYTTIDFTPPANPSRTNTAGCTTCHASAAGCGNGN
jgi:hypothetical protein